MCDTESQIVPQCCTPDSSISNSRRRNPLSVETYKGEEKMLNSHKSKRGIECVEGSEEENNPKLKASKSPSSSLFCTEDSLQEVPMASEAESDAKSPMGLQAKENLLSPNQLNASQMEDLKGSDDEDEPREKEDDPEDFELDSKYLDRSDQLYASGGDSIWTIQVHLKPAMRSQLIDWLYEVSDCLRLQRQTTQMPINYVDRFLSIQNINIRHFQLLGLASLYVASKFQEVESPTASDLVDLSDGDCNVSSLLEMERILIQRLQWKLSPPTSFLWLKRFLDIARKKHSKPFPMSNFVFCQQMIEYFSLDSMFTKFTAKKIAACAFYLAEQFEDAELKETTGFYISELEPCLSFLSEFEPLLGSVERQILESIGNETFDRTIHNPRSLPHALNIMKSRKGVNPSM
eukprot:TRINITY_DN14931_c0_g1_i1.p1 TRINITY_DN14931_c0_g1~~TRINITY_DN14931_c0_g1_i1.p1  ORF type:complete len:404 (+),score=77.64 TRINITY_DN14931_c0_g1_i1:118-1329(+)